MRWMCLFLYKESNLGCIVATAGCRQIFNVFLELSTLSFVVINAKNTASHKHMVQNGRHVQGHFRNCWKFCPNAKPRLLIFYTLIIHLHNIYKYMVCMCIYPYACVYARTYGSQNNLWESVFSFHLYMSSVIRLRQSGLAASNITC